MAAALFRRGAGLCVRCIHRELCRVVWRPQTALFSSKSSDSKQPRRTHIKKAKPQPAMDVAKLLEQLFSQQRPPAGKARPTKAISKPTKPLTTSSVKGSTSNVPPLSKTDPSVSAFAGASGFKQVDSIPELTTSTFSAAAPSPPPNSASPTNPNTSNSLETPQQSPLDFAADSVSNVTVSPVSITAASLESEGAALEGQTLTETLETNVETASEPVEFKTATVSAATAEPFIETTTVELNISPVEVLESKSAVPETPVEPTVDLVPAEEAQAMVDVLQTTKEEPLIETTIESQVEASSLPVKTLEIRAAVAEVPVEPTIDITVDVAAETKNTNSVVAGILHTAGVEPLLEATVDASTSLLETLESRAAVAECPVDPTVDATVDAPAQAVQTNSTDPGHITLSHIAENDPVIETTVEPSVEPSTSPQETLATVVAEGSVETTIETEADTAAQVVQTNNTDTGVLNVSYGAKEEPLIEAVEPAVEASTSLESRASVSDGTVKPTFENEAAESLHAQESTPLPLKNEVESTLESTAESSSGNVAAEEEANKPEKMTLESVTLHVVEVQVESLKMDELHQTKSTLDEKAEEELQELLVQTGTGVECKATAETEKSKEDESEILTEALSKWDSLSEDLQELEGESGTLVKELFCHVPAVPAKAPGTVNTSDHPLVGANGESLQMEKEETETEAMTLESVTLSEVKAGVEDLETEVLLETRNALEKEAEVQAEEEKMEVKTTVEDVFEDTTEAEILNLDSILEATDAIEAERSVLLEAMFGSEQRPRQPPDTLIVDQKLGQQDKVIDQEAEKRSGDQEGSVLEAMTLESVTLTEVEASLGTLENESLSETTDYLEKEAEMLAGEKKIEVEDGVVSEETTESLDIESLSLPEDDALSEVLQTDALIVELLFTVPGHVTRVTEGHIGQEDATTDILDATVDTGSADVDSVAAVTGDFQDSAALKEELLGQEVEKEEAQTEALGNEDGTGAHTNLDPVQRLFLEKIREYNNMHRLNGSPLETEPDYEKYLSEETAKLQRLYGGGDLSSFPEFTFTEPEMDQDSK